MEKVLPYIFCYSVVVERPDKVFRLILMWSSSSLVSVNLFIGAVYMAKKVFAT
jgi:hypothetical protein